MAAHLFADVTILNLLANHVIDTRPPRPEHEWAVDDLHFLLERFGSELTLRVAAPVREEHRRALDLAAERYQATWALLNPEGVPHLEACRRERIRYFLQAEAPSDAYRDRVLRETDIYIVDPMACLSHLHARLLARGNSHGSGS